jgi:hypothetical protein
MVKTLMGESGATGVEIAQFGREQARATLEQARKGLDLNLHTLDRGISTHDKHDFAAQQADLDREAEAVKQAEVKKVLSHEEATAKLEQIDDRRAALVEQNAQREAQAQERVNAARQKLLGLQLKDDEKKGASQEQLAADLQQGLALQFQAIEARKQQEIAARGDVQAAELEAEAAKQSAIAETRGQVEDLLAKQEKSAGLTRSMLSERMGENQVGDYLNKPTRERWFAKDSGLSEFSLDSGVGATTQDTGPLVELRNTLATFAPPVDKFSSAVNTFASVIGQSPQQFQAHLASQQAAATLPFAQFNTGIQAQDMARVQAADPSNYVDGDTSGVARREVRHGRLIDHDTGASGTVNHVTINVDGSRSAPSAHEDNLMNSLDDIIGKNNSAYAG